MNGFLTRRGFLVQTTLGTGAWILPWVAKAEEKRWPGGRLRFGLIADVHQDIMHDGEQRLRAFVDRMRSESVDCVIQLGDFCTPAPRNKAFLEIWRSFEGARYHVLGNHDMDGGFSRDQAVEFLNMPARYYSFDLKGVHFVILDGNDPGPGQKPYYRYIGDDQAQWLSGELARAELPVLVFTHQPLDHATGGVANHAQIRRVLEGATQGAQKKVIACFSGHLHRDYCHIANGIPYIQINSAAYFWIGPRFAHERYGPEIERRHPVIRNTVPYKEPLWAIATIDFVEGAILVEGRSSEFVGPSPWELGADRREFDADTIAPRISDRQLPISS